AIGIVLGLLLLVLVLSDALLKTNFAAPCLNNFQAFQKIFFVSSCISLVVAFWLLAQLFMSRSVRWIADRDRTRYWHDEPLYRRSRFDDQLALAHAPRPRL